MSTVTILKGPEPGTPLDTAIQTLLNCTYLTNEAAEHVTYTASPNNPQKVNLRFNLSAVKGEMLLSSADYQVETHDTQREEILDSLRVITLRLSKTGHPDLSRRVALIREDLAKEVQQTQPLEETL